MSHTVQRKIVDTTPTTSLKNVPWASWRECRLKMQTMGGLWLQTLTEKKGGAKAMGSVPGRRKIQGAGLPPKGPGSEKGRNIACS